MCYHLKDLKNMLLESQGHVESLIEPVKQNINFTLKACFYFTDYLQCNCISSVNSVVATVKMTNWNGNLNA